MTMATNRRALGHGVIDISSSPEPEIIYPTTSFHAPSRSQAPRASSSGRQPSKHSRVEDSSSREAYRGDNEHIVVEDLSDMDADPSSSMAKPQAPRPPPAPAKSSKEGPRETTPTYLEPLTIDDVLVKVLEVIPDVRPDHAAQLIQAKMFSNPDNTFEAVLNNLFDDLDYPKVDVKGKRKRPSTDGNRATGPQPANKQVKLDYGNKDRPRPTGQWYTELAVNQLCQDFRYIRKEFARESLRLHNGLYYPTYHYLARMIESGNYTRKKFPTPLSKGKSVMRDPEFEAERASLLAELQGPPKDAGQPIATPQDSVHQDGEVPEGEGIECGCCFGEFAFDKMIQCPDAHLFCRDCARRNAEEAIGNRKALITCMDQSGCKQPFSFSEINRFLPEKGILLWEKLKAEKEINDAKIEGLEECPFCDFKIIIENDQEKLFRCANEECGIFSCRECKKEDHLPKSCKEVEMDRQHDARHAIEEAMTEALMRKCPKCSKAFIKEHGCNKMACPHCQALSCYVCRQLITGYEHFNQAPPGSQSKQHSDKCPLWDDVEARHHDEVAEAARVARERQLAANPEINHDVLKVDLPAVPRPNPHAPNHVRPVLPPAPLVVPQFNPVPYPGGYYAPFGPPPGGIPIQPGYGRYLGPGPAAPLIPGPEDVARRHIEEQMQLQEEMARFEAARIQVARRVRRR